MSFMMNADEKKLKTVGTTREFADAFVPYVETEVETTSTGSRLFSSPAHWA